MANPPIDVSGKVALVTGGNGGIGLGMAQALADASAGVCIWGRNEEKNAVAAEQLKAAGGDVLALVCDVANEEHVEEAFQATLDHFGKVDGCFANAGIGGGGAPFHEMTTESWRRVLGVNLDGTFFTYRAAVRHMIDRGEGGRLVATSSVSAVDGAPRSQHYASSKGGLNAMTRGLAVELARHNITANTILPGWIETAMTENSFADERFEANVLKRVPFRRWGQPTDFGGIAVYLMSDASAYHTGDEFIIDGGYTKF
ncbi:MAG TPA: SDR family NAD(P)-dependent oxidoreductase [Dehalococcoidia bacterium]|nr:SDR family NAD(P)-dependent oxidoreductase [Dehalococcoidia bacterium]